MKTKDLIDSVLYEKEQGKIKIFYKINVSIASKVNIKQDGALGVPEKDVDNIQTLDDLLSYLQSKKPKVMNDLVKEIILNLTQGQEIGDLINKEDKIQISIDYGYDLGNSIGLKINKPANTENIVLVMKKNNNVIPGDFMLSDFNRQIVYFRNAVLGD